jgi:hypothetical protein
VRDEVMAVAASMRPDRMELIAIGDVIEQARVRDPWGRKHKDFFSSPEWLRGAEVADASASCVSKRCMAEQPV